LHEATPADKARLAEYLGYEAGAEEISWTLIYLALNSAANTAIIPLQDILNLGPEGRMNLPSETHGNWQWRFPPQALTPDLAAKLREATLAGRR
jgi:4-alpha-glucanotransferase